MVVPNTQEMVREKDDLCYVDLISISFSIFLHDVNIVQATSNERQKNHQKGP